MLKRLRSYLLRYSKRYGKRLVNPGFVAQTSLTLLFENHFTLGRILLEFADKVSGFTEEDLRDCFWWAWSPLFWPTIVGLGNVTTWDILIQNGHSAKDLRETWGAAGLDLLTSLLMTEAMGTPPGWRKGLRDTPLVQRFLAIRELIKRMRDCLGADAFDVTRAVDSPSDPLWGLRSIHDLWAYPEQLADDRLDALQVAFDHLADYRAPAEEKFARLSQLERFVAIGQDSSAEAKDLADSLASEGLGDALDLFLQARVPIKPQIGNADYCPRCFVRLPGVQLRNLRAGGLVLCDNCRQVLIYWRPGIPKVVV